MTMTCLQERVYDVGSHCASRVHLYHSLWHYKRRLRCQLKKELKAARLFLEVRVAHHPHLPDLTMYQTSRAFKFACSMPHIVQCPVPIRQ